MGELPSISLWLSEAHSQCMMPCQLKILPPSPLLSTARFTGLLMMMVTITVRIVIYFGGHTGNTRILCPEIIFWRKSISYLVHSWAHNCYSCSCFNVPASAFLAQCIGMCDCTYDARCGNYQPKFHLPLLSCLPFDDHQIAQPPAPVPQCSHFKTFLTVH
jgi:hypothetical protein